MGGHESGHSKVNLLLWHAHHWYFQVGLLRLLGRRLEVLVSTTSFRFRARSCRLEI
jgi:hypothetical protein